MSAGATARCLQGLPETFPSKLQAAFFTAGPIVPQDGFKYVGATSAALCLSAWTLWFPMWGGMIWPAKEGATEEVRLTICDFP